MKTNNESEKERRDRILAQLKDLSHSDDPECAHVAADCLLLELIGDSEIEEAYNKIHKWYA